MKPETLLAAANLVDPDMHWYIDGEGRVCARHEEDGKVIGFTFFSPENSADAYSLWKALAERGIVIIFCGGLQRWTVDIPGQKSLKMGLNESDVDAMLAAVEALEAMK